jgi:hypothetical protein
MKFHNPIAFTPLPVTVITSVVYLLLIVALLVVHLVVPSAPTTPTPAAGVNLTEAWLDLQTLTTGFHPYNSRLNDGVRDWLLSRLEKILQENGVSTTSDQATAVLFSDMTSNITFSVQGPLRASPSSREPGIGAYFEGTNIIVYIRGSEDDDGDWWTVPKRTPGKGGVLVSAHYDSVSTGFGATDDGVGVVTILQLIKHFTSAGQQPKRGIVALLNNGEEDFLNGARAFTRHPMSRFTHTFLNLEGAGAGGRATLVRATDTEVVRRYQKSRYPFATIFSGDVFRRGIIRSQTDYIIFNDVLGLRGLDLAFMEPRARYHTEQDDTRHTSIDSLWHMLSSALATIHGLSSDVGSTFDGGDAQPGKVPSGHGSDAVYFDLFGEVLIVFSLRTLFALSVTLLTAAPLVLIIIGAILYKFDKLYIFSSSKHYHRFEGDDLVRLHGWRGISRQPVIFLIGSAAVVGLAFLVTKLNRYIVYSSPYAVWSMLISAWVFATWFFSRAIDFWRPSAFHRVYALLWMFAGGWLILVVATVLEHRFRIGSGYFVVIYFAAIFVATLISFLELFRLPRKSAYAEEIEGRANGPGLGSRPATASSRALITPSADERFGSAADVVDDEDDEEGEDEETTESTALLRDGRQATFAHYTSPHPGPPDPEPSTLEPTKKQRVYGAEQEWSWALPRWTWFIQFLLLAPVVIILVGQLGLLAVTGIHQTPADGNPTLMIYVGMAVFVILLFAPLGPFLHRYTYHIPTFLLLVCVGTAIYNLVAFPFSPNNRLKLYFLQTVDLDTGANEVLLTGINSRYLDEAVRSIPSAAGQTPKCSESLYRKDLIQCGWKGLPPRVVRNTSADVPPSLGYADWLSFNVTRDPSKTEAHFHLWGRDTRACKITFTSPISDFSVEGAADDKRFSRATPAGNREIRLWSRTWEKPWNVTVRWEVSLDEPDRGDGLDGRVICLWSDDNESGTIPALDEIRHFAPDWVAISKTSDGLVEGSKAFLI